jgi:hypothetical protein
VQTSTPAPKHSPPSDPWRQLAEELDAIREEEDRATERVRQVGPLVDRLEVVLRNAVDDQVLDEDEAGRALADVRAGAAERAARMAGIAAEIERRHRAAAEEDQRRRRQAAQDERDVWRRFVVASHQRAIDDIRHGRATREELAGYMRERHQLAAGVGVALPPSPYCAVCRPAVRSAA